MKNESDFNYECIEPELGHELWRYYDPDTDPAMVSNLDMHLTLCHKCSQQVALQQVVERGIENGSLVVDEPRKIIPFKIPTFGFAAAGAIAVAACLVMMLLMPVQPAKDGLSRGPGYLGFVAPISSEVIFGDMELSWNQVAGATGYKVRLESADGLWQWSGETSDTSITIPSTDPSKIKAILTTVPADLAPIGGWNRTFISGNLFEYMIYRAEESSIFVRLLGFCGIMLLISTLFLRRLCVDNS